jgi:hypothetical protein
VVLLRSKDYSSFSHIQCANFLQIAELLESLALAFLFFLGIEYRTFLRRSSVALFLGICCKMAFKDGEMTVVESPVVGHLLEKAGLTPQDQIDMAEVGKKQQFNVSTSSKASLISQP